MSSEHGHEWMRRSVRVLELNLVNGLFLLVTTHRQIRIRNKYSCIPRRLWPREVERVQDVVRMAHPTIFFFAQEDVPSSSFLNLATESGDHSRFVPNGPPFPAFAGQQKGSAPKRRMRFASPAAQRSIVTGRTQKVAVNDLGYAVKPNLVGYCRRRLWRSKLIGSECR